MPAASIWRAATALPACALLAVGLTACGGSSSAVRSASASGSPSGGASASVSSSQHDAAALDRAMAATVLGDQHIVPVTQGEIAQGHQAAAGAARAVAQAEVDPAPCRQALVPGQLGSDPAGSAPMSVGQDAAHTVTLMAYQLAPGAADPWDDSLLHRCPRIRVRGGGSGVRLDSTITLVPLAVTSSRASAVHAVVRTSDSAARVVTDTFAVARVGDVEIRTLRKGRVDGARLQQDLDALATQVRRLG